MTRKIIFTAPFYHTYGTQPLCLLGCYTTELKSWHGRSCITYIFLHDLPPFLHLLHYGRKERANRDRSEETRESWPASAIMQEHLQNLISQWYMTAAELAICCVPEDSASPAPVGGYIVACVMFYERGFGVPSHQFLYLLLQFYGLELHHLTPLGILHIAAFVTMCEAYMGIEPHLDLWNYFFCARLWPGSDAKAMVWGSVDIFVRSGSGIDPYFLFLMFDSPAE
jgi:hypothetical protein